MDFEDKLSQQQHRNEAATATRRKNHELALQIKPQIRKQTIIALKQIPETPSGWGYNDISTFRKLDPTDLLEHCPSCGTGVKRQYSLAYITSAPTKDNKQDYFVFLQIVSVCVHCPYCWAREVVVLMPYYRNVSCY